MAPAAGAVRRSRTSRVTACPSRRAARQGAVPMRPDAPVTSTFIERPHRVPGPGHRRAHHRGEGVRMGEVGAVRGPGDLHQLGAPGVCSASHATVSRCRGADCSPRPKVAGTVQLGHVEGWLGGPDGGELGLQGRSVGPSFVLGRLGQPIPGGVADHASEETLGGAAAGSSSSVAGRCRPGSDRRGRGGGRRAAGPAARATASAARRPRPRRIAATARRPEGRAEGHVASVAVADHHGRPAVDHGEQIVDVAVEGGVEGQGLVGSPGSRGGRRSPCGGRRGGGRPGRSWRPGRVTRGPDTTSGRPRRRRSGTCSVTARARVFGHRRFQTVRWPRGDAIPEP